MELRDLFVTPVVIVGIFLMARFAMPYVTNDQTRRYFFPALTVKIIGALAVGFVYQFYYDSGDTFMYHTFGSRQVWQAIFESPMEGLSMIFRAAGDYTGVYKYASRVFFFKDANSYQVVRIATIFDLFTYSSYAATASLFGALSFLGTWLLYLTFYKQYPHLHFALAISICFIPSVFFWGSGILKDTIVMSLLGVTTYLLYRLFFERRFGWFSVLVLIFSIYYIYSIRKFVLQAYLPAAIIWILAAKFADIRSTVLKALLVPAVAVIAIISSYYSVVKVGEGDQRYSLDKIAETAKVTAYDIRYWSGRDAGSGYSLGELDGSLGSIISLSPKAINVSLFRPYLWEVKNPLMLLSALEGFVFLVLTVLMVLRRRLAIVASLRDANILFCLIFSISFAFAVGVSTYNFGTLARYKIPLLPFFAVALALIFDYSKRDKKFEVFEDTE